MRHSHPQLVAAGTVVGRYEILTEIASGGMATVYLARIQGAAGFERLVAIKCCHRHLRDDPQFATMFLDEARLAAKIHHPNVVATLDVGDSGELLYMVMEYIQGGRLTDLIKAANDRDTRVPVGVAVRVVLDAVNGLAAAHELRDHDDRPLHIVHRDVSPQNVLVGTDGVSRIADFGIARAVERATVTRTGEIKGKLSYMAPEQLEGADATASVDIFASGIVLWETLVGRRLFSAETDILVYHKVMKGLIERPSRAGAETTPALDSVVMKALERDPKNRFASAAEFAEALENANVPALSVRAVSRFAAGATSESSERLRSILRGPSATFPAAVASLDSNRPSVAPPGAHVTRPDAGPPAASRLAEHSPPRPSVSQYSGSMTATEDPAANARPVRLIVGGVCLFTIAALSFAFANAAVVHRGQRADRLASRPAAQAPPPLIPPQVAPPVAVTQTPVPAEVTAAETAEPVVDMVVVADLSDAAPLGAMAPVAEPRNSTVRSSRSGTSAASVRGPPPLPPTIFTAATHGRSR